MGKKKLIMLGVLLLTGVLLGVAVFELMYYQKSDEPAEKPQKKQEQPAEPAEKTADPAVALAMSNHNDEGLFLISGDQVYYSDFNADGRAMLVRSDLDGSHKEIILEDSDAAYLTEYKDALYMIIWTRDRGSVLCTMDKDGSNYKELVTGAVDLQIADDQLYYNKADTTNPNDIVNGGYFTAQLDGTGESQLLEKETYDNFVVDGKIYYQDEQDGQQIRVIDLETQEDKQVTKTHSHGFVLDGDKAYYIDTGDTGDVDTGNLTEMDMATGDTKVIAGDAYKDVLVVRESTILYCDGANNYRLSQLDKGESGKLELAAINNPDYVYAFGDWIMFFDYDYSWRYVEGVYRCRADGGDLKRLDE